jgi:hypothetical protein
LKLQPNSLTIKFNGQVGMQRRNIRTLEAYNCHIKIKQKIEEKRRLRREYTAYEQLQARDYLK